MWDMSSCGKWSNTVAFIARNYVFWDDITENIINKSSEITFMSTKLNIYGK